MSPYVSFGWQALAEFMKRRLPWYLEPEEPLELENVAPAPRAEELALQRRIRAKGIRTCELEFDDIAVNAMVLKSFEGGADIRLPTHLKNLPAYFTLKFAQSEKYDCAVRWRERDKVGVSFL